MRCIINHKQTYLKKKICIGNALMVPVILEQEEGFNIKFLDDYEPPIQDFIL